MERIIFSNSAESRFDFSYAKPSAISEEVSSLIRAASKVGNLPDALGPLGRAILIVKEGIKKIPFNPVQKGRLDYCVEMLSRNGFTVANPIFLCEDPRKIYGFAGSDGVYLTEQAFNSGKTLLIGTLIEETLHYTYKIGDNTREFQDFVLNAMANLILGKDLTPLMATMSSKHDVTLAALPF